LLYFEITVLQFSCKQILPLLYEVEGYGRKAKKVFVMSNGKVKKVMFGDPNMPVRKSNPKARASFRARHKCSTAKDKTTARYWACRDW
jgi:hypothetical protein